MASKTESDTIDYVAMAYNAKNLTKELWCILFTNNHVDMI
jgi:hypothetical protein